MKQMAWKGPWPNRVKPQAAWTVAETEKARNLRAKGYTYKMIGRAIGRTEGSVMGKMRDYSSRNYRATYGVAKSPDIPLWVVTDRNKRVFLEQQDLTGRLMNDPLPGFSALDKKRRAPL